MDTDINSIETQSDIESAVYARLEEYLQEFPIDCAYPNDSYSPTEGKPYLEFVWFHGTTSQASIGPNYKIRCRGVLQINSYVPGGSGEYLSSEISKHLKKYFKTGTKCELDGVQVRITKFYFGTKSGNNAWYYTPINLAFIVDIKN